MKSTISTLAAIATAATLTGGALAITPAAHAAPATTAATRMTPNSLRDLNFGGCAKVYYGSYIGWVLTCSSTWKP